MKRSDLFLLLLLLSCVSALGQSNFKYRRIVSGVGQEAWYTVPLPADIYPDVNRDLSDIRLYSLHEQDTMEIPYLLDIRNDEVAQEKVDLTLFNKSFLDGVLYLTFELKENQKVNYIDLGFDVVNYVGLVTVEGSDDRRLGLEV